MLEVNGMEARRGAGRRGIVLGGSLELGWCEAREWREVVDGCPWGIGGDGGAC